MSEVTHQSLEIQLATHADFSDFCELLNKANEYSIQLSDKKAWTVMDHVYAGMEGRIARGECYVLRASDGTISSSISLSDKSDEWGMLGEDEQALYFAKLMKDPAVAADEEAKQLLVFAAQEAMRHGKRFLRCDTVAELDGLVNYYERLGFRSRGHFIYESSNRTGVLLEAPVSQFVH